MYDFIDVTETSEGVSLPSEALQINGEYIEDLISGYRTLTVEGREALSPEVDTYETGIRDGSMLKGKRYPARVIRITYQIIATSDEEFRNAYNKLASILNVTDATLIFNDETDKYFIGTPSKIGEVTPGRNSVVGDFEILCLDPFKYSVTEYEASMSAGGDAIVLNYNGTHKSFPILEAEFFNEDEVSEDGETNTALTGNGDCGYVAFFNEDEKIIQLGDPDEIDGEDIYNGSQTLTNQKFDKISSFGTAGRSGWFMNSGKTSPLNELQDGSLEMGIASQRLTGGTQEKPDWTNLLKIESTLEKPYICYEIRARERTRRETSVIVDISIAVWLKESDNYFGKPYSLWANIAGQDIQLKKPTIRWEGTKKHTFTVSVNYFGLTTSTNMITGIKFKAYRNDNTGGKSGIIEETACRNLTISQYPVLEPETYYLKAKSFGIGSAWHGPSMTRVVPADSNGESGAANFKLTYSQKMCISSESAGSNQAGAFYALLVSGSGASRKIVAGVVIQKYANGKNANLLFYVNGTQKAKETIDLSYNNKNFQSGKESMIRKFGPEVQFNICGIAKSFKDESIENVVVNEYSIAMLQFGQKTALEHNGLYYVKFVKEFERWRNIPNKFSANDIVQANCKTGEILLNGLSSPDLGALGNDWEGFYLKPGTNIIGCSYSEFVDSSCAPTFKVKYREVFL